MPDLLKAAFATVENLREAMKAAEGEAARLTKSNRDLKYWNDQLKRDGERLDRMEKLMTSTQFVKFVTAGVDEEHTDKLPASYKNLRRAVDAIDKVFGKDWDDEARGVLRLEKILKEQAAAAEEDDGEGEDA